ncbi:MAG: glycogen/starch synthase [Candidatus Aenigmarchaeota archaeon]|nr:glycogen/starch synthase [Candidatus Aenigmarchaeota archaeon]
MKLKPKTDVCFEVSFECGNKVGGIFTVLSSKAKHMKKIYKDYITIGFLNKANYLTHFAEEETPKEIEKVFKQLEPLGIKCYWGRWITADDVRLILIDSEEFMKREINNIKAKLWEDFKVDSLRTGHDYDEPVAWSVAAGMLIEKLVKLKRFKGRKIVVHFHEWLSGAGLLYLYKNKVPVSLVFTTHATRIGRAKSSSGEDLLKEVEIGLKEGKVFEEEKAKEYFLEAQHKIEKLCANLADCFTTVSEIVADESAYILGKRPDIITPNGWDVKSSPPSRVLTVLHEKNRKKINEFLEAVFSPYYPIETKNNIVFFISGRYEFRNKGIDVFIDALGELNKRLKEMGDCKKSVFAFILVPSNVSGPNKNVLENIIAYQQIKEVVKEELERIEDDVVSQVLIGKTIDLNEPLSESFVKNITVFSRQFVRYKERTPPICVFDLNYDENKDLILQRLKQNGLLNRKEDIVKVIFYPTYVSPNDGLLNMDYFDFVNGASMGVFPSRYEPWGYTPFETAVMRTLVVTTDVAGFGITISKMCKDKNPPIRILHIRNKTDEEIVKELAKIMEECVFMEEETRTMEKMKTRALVRSLDWSILIENYIMAHNLSLENMKSRLKLNL